MDDQKLILIELDLAFAIKAFQEGENFVKTPEETHKSIQNYILNFCLKHNLNLDETLKSLNPLLAQNKKISKNYIIPKEENHQKDLIQTFLFDHLNQVQIPFGDMEKAKPVIDSFCDITGLDSSFATDSILEKTRMLQKEFIETALYEQILNCQKTSASMEEFVRNSREIINVLSDEINSPKKYTLSILKEKFQKKLSTDSDTKKSPVLPEDEIR